MPVDLDELDKDSEDLADSEVESAVPMPSEDAMLKHLKSIRCGLCENPLGAVVGHARRKRGAFQYGRMSFVCCGPDRHPYRITVRMDWIQPEST
jgi:hypothetical protein